MYWNCYYLPFPSKIRPLKTRKALFFRKVNKNNSFKCDSSDKRSISTTDDSGRAIKADIRVSRSLCADVNFYPKTSRIMNVWVWVRGVTSSRFDVDETLQCRLNKNRNVKCNNRKSALLLMKIVFRKAERRCSVKWKALYKQLQEQTSYFDFKWEF